MKEIIQRQAARGRLVGWLDVRTPHPIRARVAPAVPFLPRRVELKSIRPLARARLHVRGIVTQITHRHARGRACSFRLRFLGDDVDDAAECTLAINRGGTAANHLNALDALERNGIPKERRVACVVHLHAVHQHERSGLVAVTAHGQLRPRLPEPHGIRHGNPDLLTQQIRQRQRW